MIKVLTEGWGSFRDTLEQREGALTQYVYRKVSK